MRGSALTGLEAALHLVDHIDAALAAHQAVVAVTPAQRFQRVTDLHGTSLKRNERPCAAGRKTANGALSRWRPCRPGRAGSRPWRRQMSIRTAPFQAVRGPKTRSFRPN